jgi:two-component system, cell cycle response regulator
VGERTDRSGSGGRGVRGFERARATHRLNSAWRLRFVSLPTRIVVAVFSAALITGIAVSAISIGYTQGFLREKIDDRFPELLRWAANELDQWYAQREVDIATFAASETLVSGLAPGRIGEARRYLDYVLRGFPQYQHMFVLDDRGAVRVTAGGAVELPGPLLKDLIERDGNHVSAVIGTSTRRLQVVSAPIRGRGARIGTLVAVVDIATLDAQLGERDLDEGVGLYVVGPGSTVLARSPGAPDRITYERAIPALAEVPVVADYKTPDGAHVVGSALRLGRFDWTLVVEQDYDVAFEPALGAMGEVLPINLAIVLGFALIALSIARSIVRPIRALSDSARRIAQGETDIEIVEVPGQDEIAVLSRALREMVDRLRRQQIEVQRKQEQIERANSDLTRANEELHRSNEILEQLSFTDGLTHLHNHRYFQDRMRLEAKRSDRSREPLALLLIDIDHFKALNDHHGHAAGDEVLRRVATILDHTARETDLVARYGGEEFAVLAPRTDAKGAQLLAERVRQAIAEAQFHGLDPEDSSVLSVTASVGVSTYRGDLKRFFNEADRALYQAKREGRDCVTIAPAP